MEPVILMPKYRKGKKPTRVRKPSRPIDGINHRLLREQALQAQPVELVEIVKIEETPADDAPPTRLELVDKAKELGLKFTKRTSDKKLLAMINEAIGG
jgi:hypothetical protein